MTDQASPRIIIDLIVPVFNESNFMIKNVEEMIQIVSTAGYQPNLILVDDGSKDDTWLVIQALSKKNSRIQGVRLSRNFGKDNALFTGLRYAHGEAVITIDSDGQHPINLIPSMLKAWKDGAMVVHAVKQERIGETFLMKLRAGLFNYFMSKLIHSDQAGVSDYKLLDKKMVEILRQHEISNAIYRFSVANLGFSSAKIPMNTLPTDRPTRWRFTSLFQLAIRAVMFHTDIPLKALVALMIFTVALCTWLMISLLISFYSGRVPSGYSTLLTLNLLTLCLSIVGFTGLAVYLKGTLDIVAGRSGAIVWQQTSKEESL